MDEQIIIREIKDNNINDKDKEIIINKSNKKILTNNNLIKNDENSFVEDINVIPIISDNNKERNINKSKIQFYYPNSIVDEQLIYRNINI